MIGFTQHIFPGSSASPDGGSLGGDATPAIPKFRGAADVIFDGKYLWISNRDFFGTPTLNTNDQMVWVIDPSPGIPRVVKKIDLTAFTFKVVRSLTRSNDGQYIYACLAGDTGTAGRCLIINKDTFQVVGNAQVTTAAIGSPTPFTGGRAVYALDDGAGHLWVVNSNQSRANAIERFSLSSVLGGGASPTGSVQIVNMTTPYHAEELAIANGFLWTTTSAYGVGASQIDLTTGAIVNQTTANICWGPRYLAGALWGGDFNRGITRLDPTQFGTGGFQTDFVNIYPVTTGSNSTNLGGFAYDGTYVWTGGGFYSRDTKITSGSNGATLPQSVINVVSTALFPSSGSLLIQGSNKVIFYTGKTSTSFTGCSGGTGQIFTNNTLVDRRITLKKLSTSGGSVAVVGSVEVYNGGISDSGYGFYNLTFDGQFIWAVQRTLSGINALIKIDPVAEQHILSWPIG